MIDQIATDEDASPKTAVVPDLLPLVTLSKPLSVKPDRPLPKVWGDYEDVTPIAEGGMGIVYRAYHIRLKRIEAIKVIRAGQFASDWDAYRFRFEAEAAAGLAHPNIVSVYGGGEIEGVPYFAMEWIDGGDLADRAAEIREDPRKVAEIIAKIAHAVHHAHKLGILHRDLKPANILLDSAGEPRITDFGLAKRTDADLSLTATGTVIGTPQFMAPEQARGEKGLTTAVDIYALGGILYQVLTGKPPFNGRNIPDIIKRITSEPPPTPRSVVATTNQDLEAICLKCLEKNPNDRYESAEAMAQDLERYLKGEPVSVRPPGLLEWAKREVAKTPPQFPGYVWQVKIWFGVIILLSQIAVFTCAQLEAPAWTVWAAFIASWVSAAVALWWQMAAKFTRLPATEQHSVMIAIGHIAGHIALAVAILPWTGTAVDSLKVYPAMFAVSGLALFVVGTTHWGMFYLFAMIVTSMAPLAAVWPYASPLLFGGSLAAAMWYWAYAVKVKFGGEAE